MNFISSEHEQMLIDGENESDRSIENGTKNLSFYPWYSLQFGTVKMYFLADSTVKPYFFCISIKPLL